MIRILKNADFSGCGLDKIELPIPPSTEANEIVAKFQGITPEKEQKLRAFIDKLVFSGLYEELTYLGIPYVARTEEQAIQNVLLSSTDTQPAAIEGLTLDSDGLKFTVSQGNYRGLLVLSDYRKGTAVSGEFSMGGCIVYPTSTDYNLSGGATMIRRHYTGNDYARIVLSGNASQAALKAYLANGPEFASQNSQGSQDGNDNKAIQIISCSQALQDDVQIEENGGYALNGINTIKNIDVDTQDDDNTPYMGGALSACFPGKYRLFFEGKPLTVGEIEYLRDAIKELCDVNF